MLEHSIAPTTGVGYEIANSLRFNDDDVANLTRTPSSASNQRTYTYSTWVKRGNLVRQYFGIASLETHIEFAGTDNSQLYVNMRGGATNYFISTNALFRDPSAWYHIVWAVDTTQATASDRVKLYVNGELMTSLADTGYPPQNHDTSINSTNIHYLGRSKDSTPFAFDGHMAEVNFIDGQALDPSNFGETGDYGEWKPIKYEGTYGTNGFYLDFENSGSLGADVSGNGNNWTPTNLAATDQMLDSPTNNFGTGNNLQNDSNTYTEGNLKIAVPFDKNNMGNFQAPTSGKWYFEILVNSVTTNSGIGLASSQYNINNNGFVNAEHRVWKPDGGLYGTGSGSYGTTYTTNDIIGVVVDTDANTLGYYKNGVSAGTAFSDLSGKEWFAHLCNYSGTTATFTYNFGQDSSFAGNKTAQGNSDGNGYGDFYYTPPSGYLALCTQNLPDPTVIPSEHFNTVLYTGDSVSSASGGQAITGVGFQPDLNWIKSRSGIFWHMLHDAVRGAGADKRLSSNATSAEPSNGENHLMSFDTDGFTVGHDDSGSTNLSGGSYVAWNWKANGSGVSNTDGTITSTVSANQDAGFSIVNFTGTGSVGTVGHGLTQIPELIINKPRDRADNWNVYCEYNGTSDPETDYLILNSTSAPLDNNTIWNDTAPTSSVFTVGTNGGVNASGENFINYCFHSVDGFSKVGSYTGNGSADGTFVFTGFRPAYVMYKRSSGSGEDWQILDTTRSADGNPEREYLYANLSDAEKDPTEYNPELDILSNGFKPRNSNNTINASGSTYIYIAFAETPFKHTNAR